MFPTFLSVWRLPGDAWGLYIECNQRRYVLTYSPSQGRQIHGTWGVDHVC